MSREYVTNLLKNIFKGIIMREKFEERDRLKYTRRWISSPQKLNIK